MLLGPNGAGKTTLLRCVAGSLRAAQGAIHLGDSEISGPDPRVGYLSQSPQFFRSFTATEYVQYCGWLRGLSGARLREGADGALAAVSLNARAKERVGRLSGGMQRRLAIASAIVTRPCSLLLDEPLVGLDPEQQDDVQELIGQLAHESIVVISTHSLQDVAVLADRVLLLDNGQSRFTGTMNEFANVDQPTIHSLRKAYADLLRDGR